MARCATAVASETGSIWFVNDAFGSDDNPGQLLRPFKTIQKAAGVAVEGDTIVVLPGIYREWVHPKASEAPPQTDEPCYHGPRMTADSETVCLSIHAA